MQGQRPDRRWLGYVQAVVITALAAALKWALDRSFGELPTYITFYPAVVICSMLGGVGPGILATLLGLLAGRSPVHRAHRNTDRGPRRGRRGHAPVRPLRHGDKLPRRPASHRGQRPDAAQRIAGRGPGQGTRQSPGRLRRRQRRHVGDRRGRRRPAGQQHGLPLARKRRGDRTTAISRATLWAASMRWRIPPAADTRPVAPPARSATPSPPCCAPASPSTTSRREAVLSIGGKEVRLWLDVSADPLLLNGKRHVILALNNVTAQAGRGGPAADQPRSWPARTATSSSSLPWSRTTCKSRCGR